MLLNVGKKLIFLEKEPLVNKFISVPKDKGSLNCASFMAGIIGKTRVDKSLFAKYISLESIFCPSAFLA